MDSLSDIAAAADQVFTDYQKEINSIDVRYADKHKKERMAEINAKFKNAITTAEVELEQALKRSEAARAQLKDPVFDTCRRALSLAEKTPELTQAICQSIPALPLSTLEHIAKFSNKNAVVSLAVMARLEELKASAIEDDRKSAYNLQQSFQDTLPIQKSSIVHACSEELRALKVLQKRVKQPSDTLTIGHKMEALTSEIEKYYTEGGMFA